MRFDSDFWIIRPFNPVFMLVFAFFLLLLIVSSILLKGKSEKLRKTVLVTACLITLVGFFVYKYYLSLDTAFNEITASKGGFNWWGELPLQMCNINMILIPIAVMKKSRPLMSFCFFVGPLGAMMALAMPGLGFDGYSLLLPRTILATFVISFCIFMINMLLRWTRLHPNANYFFSVETEGNALLELFHKLIPIAFLYQIPCVLILGVYMLLITSGFALADRLREKKADN